MLQALDQSVEALAVSVFDEHCHVAVDVGLAVLIENLDEGFDQNTFSVQFDVGLQGGLAGLGDVDVGVAVSFFREAVLVGESLGGEACCVEAFGQFEVFDRFHVSILTPIVTICQLGCQN